ncbi:MAG: glycine--tRNA ligase [Chloroflexi bacterium]|nr:glycine--tRNA ligase [Chloroflexota bacterium]MDA1003747.1 glycine--tRNA ligase [Chloroflexota bacterium]
MTNTDAPASAMKADLETMTSLAKRRGFVFPSSEIYGGFEATYDYGPLGVAMRRNIRDAWWRAMVQERGDIVGIEAAIVTAPRVWEASGHVDVFHDPMVDCLECHSRLRADHIEDGTCPECGSVGRFSEPRNFNLMMRTNVGPVEEGTPAYLRPETAQGMFVNFENVQQTTRKRLPFGIAQIGKSFRNEITVKQFIFRTREFEQMEMEFFCHPDDSMTWHVYWKKERLRWHYSLGIRPQHLRLRDHTPEELSHYSKGTSDVEVHYPWGWGELEGIAHRGDYDLRQHAKFSGKSLSYFDPDTNEHVIPHVVEPAVGVDRVMLTLMMDAYDEEVLDGGDKRVVLHFAPDVAPVAVAVLPLSRNDRLVPTAHRVWDVLRPHFRTQYDDAQSIGRRYRRQDEIGTPLCVTIDFDTIDDDAVTIRDRDTMAQVRVPVNGLVDELRTRLDSMRPQIPSIDEIEV